MRIHKHSNKQQNHSIPLYRGGVAPLLIPQMLPRKITEAREFIQGSTTASLYSISLYRTHVLFGSENNPGINGKGLRGCWLHTPEPDIAAGVRRDLTETESAPRILRLSVPIAAAYRPFFFNICEIINCPFHIISV